MLIGKEMRLFLLQCFWTGVSESYWQGLVGPIISRSMPNATVETQLIGTLYAFSMFGVGDMIGGII